jgi:hypothetical protein
MLMNRLFGREPLLRRRIAISDVAIGMPIAITPNTAEPRRDPAEGFDERAIGGAQPKTRDHVDFLREVEEFLNALPGAVFVATREIDAGDSSGGTFGDMVVGVVNMSAAMIENPARRSRYVYVDRDSKGNYLSGSKNYWLHLPPIVPLKDCAAGTSSPLAATRQLPRLHEQRLLVKNMDDSYEIYFGPIALAGKDKNWIQTIEGKAWCVVTRLYDPVEAWSGKPWRPKEIEFFQ